MLQTCYIYEITYNGDGRNYIGQRHCPLNKTPETDTSYMGKGKHILAAEKKYGIENFSKRILAICYTQEILNILETEYIRLYKEIGKAEFNIAGGGEGGDLGEEVNKRISISLKNSERYKESLKSPERSRKISEYARNRPPEVLYAIGSANRGKKYTEERKKQCPLLKRILQRKKKLCKAKNTVKNVDNQN